MWRTWLEWCCKNDSPQGTNPYGVDEWLSYLGYAGKNYVEPLPATSGSSWGEPE